MCVWGGGGSGVGWMEWDRVLSKLYAGQWGHRHTEGGAQKCICSLHNTNRRFGGALTLLLCGAIISSSCWVSPCGLGHLPFADGL